MNSPKAHAQHPRLGTTVLLHYTCRDEDGTVLETTVGGEPDRVRLGDGDFLPALEDAILRLAPGESCHVTLPPKDGYGEYNSDLLFEVPLKMLQLDTPPEPGMLVELSPDDGDEPCPGTILECDDESCLVDCNHPFAGKTVSYDLTLVGILSE